MLPETKAIYHDGILREAMKRFGIEPGAITESGGFESFVYEFQKEGQPFILKVSHNIRRNMNLVHGELHWLNYLADQGVPVSRAIPSLQGNMIERIDADGSYFMAYAFEKAIGKLTKQGEWSDQLIREWGRTCGKMHHLTKSYQLAEEAHRRPQWHEDEIFQFKKYLPANDKAALEKCRQLLQDIRSLPMDKDCYGLIHSDLHHLNFLEHQGKITVFDFDDCEYHWFAYDLAVILYHSFNLHAANVQDLDAVQHFYAQLMQGYSTQNKLEPQWLDQIPSFLLLRHFLLYMVFHQIWDLQNLTDQQSEILTAMRAKIEKNTSLLPISFSSVAT